MAIKYTNRLKNAKLVQNIPTFSIPSSSKIFSKWDFWYENIPSGNADYEYKFLEILKKWHAIF
jgi:hypothetical protein